MKTKVTDDEFVKWRCLVALAHADGIVTGEEENVIALQLRKNFFSSTQLKILQNDMKEAQDFEALYKKLTKDSHKRELRELAYTLFWSDSDFDQAEEKIYNFLKKSNES